MSWRGLTLSSFYALPAGWPAQGPPICPRRGSVPGKPFAGKEEVVPQEPYW